MIVADTFEMLFAKRLVSVLGSCSVFVSMSTRDILSIFLIYITPL